MTITIGDRIPETILTKATAEGPQTIASGEYFAGRKVALFSVPGAFTPTCSVRHLPTFLDKADELKTKGVDEIACTAVNDAFVLAAWAKSTDAEGKVTMLSDGNGSFAKALGLDADMSKYGMGHRGQRFSMLIDDGVVRQLNVEEPGAFSVSGAETMLEQM